MSLILNLLYWLYPRLYQYRLANLRFSGLNNVFFLQKKKKHVPLKHINDGSLIFYTKILFRLIIKIRQTGKNVIQTEWAKNNIESILIKRSTINNTLSHERNS